MKSIFKIIIPIYILGSVSTLKADDCFVCGVVPQEWNIHMASNEYADEIKKKKKKGKKLKGKAGKGKKGSAWGKWKSKWKKKKEN